MKRKSVLYAWGLSYLALLLLMVALCGMLGYRARAQLIQEYKNITQTLQDRTSKELQGYFDDMATCAYEIANNYAITNFVMDPSPKKESYYNLTQIQETLKVYAINEARDVRRYLYMNNIQRALSPETIYEKAGLYQVLVDKMDLSEAEFDELLAGYHFNELRVLQGEEGETSVVMLSSIPLVRRTTRATLLQVLDQSELSNIVTSSSAVEGSTSVLLDEENRVICAIGEQELAAKLPQTELAAVKSSELRLGNETYWFQYQELSAEGWKLITVLPMAEIRERSGWIVRQSLPIIGAILLFGAALCAIFLYYNYKPLARLRKRMTGPDALAFPGNEYEQLAAAFSDARSSLEQMQVLWDDQTRRLRQEFLQSCLEGDVVYDEKLLRQMLEYLDAGFVGEWFCVALIDAPEGLEAEGAQEVQRLGTQLEKGMAGCAGACRVDILPQEGLLIALLNFESREAACQGGHAAQAVLAEAARGCRCVFSNQYRNFENIHLAYLEASEQYRLESASACPPEQETAAPAVIEVPRFSAEQEELLLRYITAGSVAEAEQMIRLVLRCNWEEQVLPVSMCRCLAYDILCGVLRSVGALPTVWETQKDLLRADLHVLRHYSEREEIAALLLKTVARTAEACAQWHSTASAKEQPLDRILQCVDAHYRETDFNVSKAADYLNMNVAYLSKLFKQQTGIGLLNYISGLRVKYAKQCILERHISVAQAAREAGFENINTFIRLFKKYEGTTPGNIAEGK